MIQIGPQIRALHWQPRFAEIGEVVEGVADIAQAIGIILLTPKRSDPHRPEFGCDAWLYLDQPVTDAIPRVIAAAWAALERWEPRARIVDIRASAAPSAAGRIVIRVTFQLAIGDQASFAAEVAL